MTTTQPEALDQPLHAIRRTSGAFIQSFRGNVEIPCLGRDRTAPTWPWTGAP
jgi:hypothetical protein